MGVRCGRSLGISNLAPLAESEDRIKLGWDFLAVVETGRFKDWRSPADGCLDEWTLFWRQVEACQMQILPGPERRLKWGVPPDLRDPLTGALIHDDLLISSALCAVLDGQVWGLAQSEVIPGEDPIDQLGDTF